MNSAKSRFIPRKILRAMISHNEDFHIMPLITYKVVSPCETFPTCFHLEENNSTSLLFN